MKFGSKFALLLAVAVAALSFGAASSFATTVTVNGAASDVFDGSGSGTLTGAITFGTITCTNVTFTTNERGGNGDGLAITNASFAGCSANLGAGTCTVSNTSANSTLVGTGAHGTNTVDTYTLDTATNSTVVCDAVVNCTATNTTTTATTNIGGTIDDAATTATLTGTTRASSGTTHCTGTVSGSGTITQDVSIAV
jgi:hypothetical protein